MEAEVAQAKIQSAARDATLTVYTIVNFIIGVIEAILALRFLLKMLGANAATPFVHWVYNIAQPLAAPFAGIFPSTVQGNSTLEWSVLIAMVGYALLSYLVIWIIGIITP